MKWRRKVSDVGQGPASLIGCRVFSVGFAYQTVLELFHQADDGTIRVHVDLVIFSPFVLRSSDSTVYNLDPATSRSALAPVIDLFGATITGVTIDGDDSVERDIAGNPVNVLGTLTVDFGDSAQITVPAIADPYQETWDLDYGSYLTLLLFVKMPKSTRASLPVWLCKRGMPCPGSTLCFVLARLSRC